MGVGVHERVPCTDASILSHEGEQCTQVVQVCARMIVHAPATHSSTQTLHLLVGTV